MRAPEMNCLCFMLLLPACLPLPLIRASLFNRKREIEYKLPRLQAILHIEITFAVNMNLTLQVNNQKEEKQLMNIRFWHKAGQPLEGSKTVQFEGQIFFVVL